MLQRVYDQYVIEPEVGYDFSVLVDLESLPAEKGTEAEPLPKRSSGG